MRDRELEVYQLFDAGARARTAALVTEEVIAEHAANPTGPHGDVLQRVLRHLRRAPLPGKYVVVATHPWQEYRIGVFTGVRGEAPTVLGDGPYSTEAEAMHAVFLRRVAELRSGSGEVAP